MQFRIVTVNYYWTFLQLRLIRFDDPLLFARLQRIADADKHEKIHSRYKINNYHIVSN